MAITAEKVQILVEAEVSKAVANLKSTTTQSDKLFSSVTKLVGAAGLTALAAKAISVGLEFSNLAANAEEVNSKFNTVFKDQAESVRTWATEYADAFGQSSTDTLSFLATIQDTLVPLGFARDAASDFSQEIVALSGDLASFNNLPTEQVVQDLQSALVGNTETLRKYGVVANETAIKQEALNSGIWDGEDSLTAQEKAAAILNITLASTTDAQGDLERTMDSTANVTRQLENAWNDFGIALGTTINEGLTPLKSSLSGVLAGITDLIEQANQAGEANRAFADGVATADQKVIALTSELVNMKKAQADANALNIDSGGVYERNIGLLEEKLALAKQEVVWMQKQAMLSEETAEAQEEENVALQKYVDILAPTNTKLQDLNVTKSESIELTSRLKEKTEDLTQEFDDLGYMIGQAMDSATGSTFEFNDALTEAEEKAVSLATAVSSTVGPVFESFGAALAGQKDGWADFADAAKSAIASVVRSLADQAVIQSAISYASLNPVAGTAYAAAAVAGYTAAGAIEAYATGGDFVTDGPQLIMVGDNPGGQERVQVTPTSSANINGPKGGKIVLEFMPKGIVKPVQTLIDNQEIIIR